VVAPRDIHADTLAAISGPHHSVVLVLVDWPTGAVRVHTGAGTLSWDGQSWIGVGPLESSISLPGEGSGMAMVEGSMTISGDDDAIDDVHEAADDARGTTVRVWYGCLTERGGTTLIGEPFEVFTGRVGQVSDEETWHGETSTRPVTIQLTAGPSQRARGSAHHSYEDQLRQDSTDTAGRLLRSALANAIQTAART